MTRQVSEGKDEVLWPSLEALTEGEHGLVEWYRQLTPQDQQYALRFLSSMARTKLKED